MHHRMMKLIVEDCRMYAEHQEPVETLNKWSKEQLAFAVNDIWRLFKLAQCVQTSDVKKKEASNDR